MKRSNDQSMKSALDEWLREARLSEKLNERRLISKWEKLFGKTIAKYSRKITVRNRTLYLTVESAPLRQEMLFNKQVMIDRINSEIAEGMIQEIVLR
ncbi:MAG: DUF721 domain-containing protein [Chitinophagales bacterium]|nr:DUF721 domain-containing protein [Chitinophagales bacterium]